ncbi:MAG TPA: hypothetical protein VGL72_09565, partial [Bryobacteraceae bacterium]
MSLAAVVILFILLLRRPEQMFGDRVRTEVERINETIDQGLRSGRSDSLETARQTREEIAGAVRGVADSLQQRLTELRDTLDTRLQQMNEADRKAEA